MTLEKAVLFVDNNSQYLPFRRHRLLIKNQFGLRSKLADANNPVSSAIKLAGENRNIVAVMTNNCGGNDPAHVRELRYRFPSLVIAFVSRSDVSEKDIAMKAGADFYFGEDDPLELRNEFFRSASQNTRLPDSFLAEKKFYEDLPKLVENPDTRGRWVAYTNEGLYAIGDTDVAVIKFCESKGLSIQEIIVTRAIPEEVELEYGQAGLELFYDYDE